MIRILVLVIVLGLLDRLPALASDDPMNGRDADPVLSSQLLEEKLTGSMFSPNGSHGRLVQSRIAGRLFEPHRAVNYSIHLVSQRRVPSQVSKGVVSRGAVGGMASLHAFGTRT